MLKNTTRVGKNNHRLRINFQVSIVFGEWKVWTKRHIRDVLSSRAAWMDAKKPPLSCYADLSSCTSINRRLSSVQRHFAFLIGRHLSPLFFFRTKFRLELVDEKRHSKKTFDTRKRLGPRPRSPLDRSRDSCEGRLLRKGLLIGADFCGFLTALGIHPPRGWTLHFMVSWPIPRLPKFCPEERVHFERILFLRLELLWKWRDSGGARDGTKSFYFLSIYHCFPIFEFLCNIIIHLWYLLILPLLYL